MGHALGASARGSATRGSIECDGSPWTLWPQEAVSGLCFDATGEHLAMSAWAPSQHYASAFLARVRGLELEGAPAELRHPDGHVEGCPTGVCFLHGRLHVRCNSRYRKNVFHSFRAPAESRRGYVACCVVGTIVTLEAATRSGCPRERTACDLRVALPGPRRYRRPVAR